MHLEAGAAWDICLSFVEVAWGCSTLSFTVHASCSEQKITELHGLMFRCSEQVRVLGINIKDMFGFLC